MISILICNKTAESICVKKNDVNKWIASIFYYFEMVTLSANVLIWEYPSVALKTLCPYCDPCDSLKIIPLSTKIISTSKIDHKLISQEIQQINSDPHSVRVVLIRSRFQYEYLQNQQAVLKYIPRYPIDSNPINIYLAADQHLTSLLLPKSANVTLSGNLGEYDGKWKNIIVDACSPENAINSHPAFRPMIVRDDFRSRINFQESRLVIYSDQFRYVSCHKKQMQ